MFEKLKNRIEENRNSGSLIWMNLARFKDILWRVNSLNRNLRFLYMPTVKYLTQKKHFDEVKTFCLFIGYPRSGHSLVAALLDAHPNIIISHELDIIARRNRILTKNQIYSQILADSAICFKEGRKRSGYPNIVPNQWQGRFRELEVIGDKKGGETSGHLLADMGIIDELKNKLGVKNVKLIHVIRNPYDNITAMHKRSGRDMNNRIEYYLDLVEKAQKLKEILGDEVILDLYHEDLIKNPKQSLQKLCRHLGVEAYRDYIHDCQSLIWESPHKRRFTVEWTSGQNRRLLKLLIDIHFWEGIRLTTETLGPFKNIALAKRV